jgi:L-alanine-DL-glutamate epimerase-like enolase superfamily enzyme
MLTTRELINTQQGFENCREAIGWDRDLMVHCHWEYDLQSSRPVWPEDPLPVDYSDSWKRLCASSKVPICTGENLARREDFKDFIVNQGCDILHADLRNSGGFLETRRIADLAHIYGLPMANHNTGSQVHTCPAAHWAASIRDHLAQGGSPLRVLVVDVDAHDAQSRHHAAPLSGLSLAPIPARLI